MADNRPSMKPITHTKEFPEYGTLLKCSITGKEFTAAPVGCMSNFCLDADGAVISAEGYTIRYRSRVAERAGPVLGYMNSEGTLITTVNGDELARVTSLVPCKHNMLHTDTNYYSFRAQAPDNCNWYGRGSRGMAITMRPCK